MTWVINLFWASNTALKHCVPPEELTDFTTPIIKTRSPNDFIKQYRIQNK